MARLRLDRRRFAALAVVLVVVVGGAVAIVIAARSGSASNSNQLQTSVARRGNLAETVDSSFTLQFGSTSALSAPSSTAGTSTGTTASAGGGVVTQLQLGPGQQLSGIVPAFEIDESQVYAVPSPTPFYRDMVAGDQGADVQGLQQALTAAGYDTGGTDGTFGTGTVDALESFQLDHGLTETGTLSLSQFVSYPPASTVIDLKAGAGQRVQGGATIADLGVGSLMANALVNQGDFPSVKVGQPATLDFDAAPGTQASGTVFALGVQAATPQQSAGSSAPVQLGVTIAPTSALPSDSRAGMTGQAHIAIVSRANVVIVPTSAVGGNGGSPTVEVVQNGRRITKPVVTGLTTGSQTEIVTGVQPGDVVVTGAIAPPQTATSTPGLGGTRVPGGAGGGVGAGQGGGGFVR